MNQEQLERLRLLVLGNKKNTEQDDLLKLLYQYATNRFGLALKSLRRKYEQELSYDIPNDLIWIVEEAVVKKFNRLSSEGMASESVEGRSVTFETNDFAAYDALLDDYFNDMTVSKSKVKFL